MSDTTTEGIGLAAGAMSKAIGDIYRGQLQATQGIPALQEHALRQGTDQQHMAERAQKFPLEMQEARQKIGLGSYALEEAPLKIQQLKGSITGQDLDRQLKDIQVKSASDTYTMTIQSREAARKFISENKTKPGMEWIAAYESNPDGFLDAWGKMKTEETKAGFRPQSMQQAYTQALKVPEGMRTPEQKAIIKAYTQQYLDPAQAMTEYRQGLKTWRENQGELGKSLSQLNREAQDLQNRINNYEKWLAATFQNPKAALPTNPSTGQPFTIDELRTEITRLQTGITMNRRRADGLLKSLSGSQMPQAPTLQPAEIEIPFPGSNQ